MAETDRVAGVILAGGGSRRMGRDKALVELGGRSLAAHVIARLAPQVATLALNANGDPARFAGFGLPVIADAHADGPLAGILTALRWARETGARHVVTVPVDTPFIPTDFVARLRAVPGDGPIAIARSRGRLHPPVGLWSTGLANALAAWIADANDLSARAWLAGQNAAMADFPDDAGGDPFFNVNTPADLENAAARLAG